MKKVRFYILVITFLVGAVTLLSYDTYTQQKLVGAGSLAVAVDHEKTFGQSDVTTASAKFEADASRQEGKPIRLVIPALDINLSVDEGVYDEVDQTWNLSSDKAQYALITPLANNQEGNTFIYGHNRREVFSRLSEITPGAEAFIHTANNMVFRYEFRSSYVTNPYDDSLFHYQGVPILTLQTCTGLWQQDRQLFTFVFKEIVS